MNKLGKRIRLLRHQKGWSQEDVAKKLNFSIPAYSKMETGITDINFSRIEQIASLYDISVSELLTFDDSAGEKAYNDRLQLAHKLIREKEAEVISLQRRLIDVYEKIQSKT